MRKFAHLAADAAVAIVLLLASLYAIMGLYQLYLTAGQVTAGLTLAGAAGIGAFLSWAARQ